MPVLKRIHDIAEVVRQRQAAGQQIFVRYSRGPAADAKSGYRSRDHQTGAVHPGLSVEIVSGPRSLADYSHLLVKGLPGTRCWLLAGTVVGRDTDNACLLTDIEPVAWVADDLIRRIARAYRQKTDLRLAYSRAPFNERQLIMERIRSYGWLDDWDACAQVLGD